MFDVLIAEVSYTRSIVHKKEIPFIKNAILALESEFEANTYATIIDFNKLICSNALYKVIILPNTKKPNNYLTPLLPMIDENSKENYWVVFVDHPKKWMTDTLVETKLYYFKDGKWELFRLNLNDR